MKKVLSMLGPHKVPLILSIFFATVNTVMQIFIPYYTKNILSEGILAYNMERLWELCLLLLGFTVLSIISSIANLPRTVRANNWTFDTFMPSICISPMPKIFLPMVCPFLRNSGTTNSRAITLNKKPKVNIINIRFTVIL